MVHPAVAAQWPWRRGTRLAGEAVRQSIRTCARGVAGREQPLRRRRRRRRSRAERTRRAALFTIGRPRSRTTAVVHVQRPFRTYNTRAIVSVLSSLARVCVSLRPVCFSPRHTHDTACPCVDRVFVVVVVVVVVLFIYLFF